MKPVHATSGSDCTRIVVSQKSNLLVTVVQTKFFICQGGLTDTHEFVLLQC